ncbi:MAG: helix-turn-helix transcriptional regulator [Acidimicrobiales bacterium]
MARLHQELEVELGESLRSLRIDQRLTQEELAKRANVSLGALKNLENGRGSTTGTLVRVAHALGQDQWLGALAPAATFNPLDLVDSRRTRATRARRVRRASIP